MTASGLQAFVGLGLHVLERMRVKQQLIHSFIHSLKILELKLITTQMTIKDV